MGLRELLVGVGLLAISASPLYAANDAILIEQKRAFVSHVIPQVKTYPDKVCTSEADLEIAKGYFNGTIELMEVNNDQKIGFGNAELVDNTRFGQYDPSTNTMSRFCVSLDPLIDQFSGLDVNLHSDKDVENVYDSFTSEYNDVMNELNFKRMSFKHEIGHYLYGSWDEIAMQCVGIFEDPLYEGPSREEFNDLIRDQYLGQRGYLIERTIIAQNLADQYFGKFEIVESNIDDPIKFALEGKIIYDFGDNKQEIINLIWNSNDLPTNNIMERLDELGLTVDQYSDAVDQYELNLLETSYYNEMWARMVEANFNDDYQDYFLELTMDEIKLFSEMKYDGIPLFPHLDDDRYVVSCMKKYLDRVEAQLKLDSSFQMDW